MAKKKNEELEEYMETHNVEVTPPKSEFRDTRMNSISCPLCKSDEVNLVKLEEHDYGEFGIYQCSNCACLLDICNMANKPAEFSLVSKLMHNNYFQSLKMVLKSYKDYDEIPRETSVQYLEDLKEEEAMAKLAKKEYCSECKKMFTPQKSCLAVREYCVTCRKEIPKEDKRWKNDARVKTTKAKPVKASKTTVKKRVPKKKANA